jgi:hypothetical protein
MSIENQKNQENNEVNKSNDKKDTPPYTPTKYSTEKANIGKEPTIIKFSNKDVLVISPTPEAKYNLENNKDIDDFVMHMLIQKKPLSKEYLSTIESTINDANNSSLFDTSKKNLIACFKYQIEQDYINTEERKTVKQRDMLQWSSLQQKAQISRYIGQYLQGENTLVLDALYPAEKAEKQKYVTTFEDLFINATMWDNGGLQIVDAAFLPWVIDPTNGIKTHDKYLYALKTLLETQPLWSQYIDDQHMIIIQAIIEQWSPDIQNWLNALLNKSLRKTILGINNVKDRISYIAEIPYIFLKSDTKNGMDKYALSNVWEKDILMNAFQTINTDPDINEAIKSWPSNKQKQLRTLMNEYKIDITVPALSQ